MKQLINWTLFVMTIFVLNGCITQQKCNDRYPAQIIIKDSTSIKIVEKTYTVTIPSESVFIHDSIPCPYFEYKKEVKHNNVTAKVVISKGKLTVECKSDSLEKLLHTKDSIITNFHSEVKIPKEVPAFKEHWYLKPLLWWFIISLLFIIVYLIFSKIKKPLF